MRLTTKIITGIILSIFLLSLLHIIGYSFSERRYFKSSYPINSITIPQENKTELLIEPYRVFVFEAEQSETEGRFFCYFTDADNGLFIHQTTTSEDNNKLFFPEDLNGFISTKTNGDTLFLKIDLEKVREQYDLIDEVNKKFKPTTRYGVPVTGVNLDLRSSKVNVINKLYRLPTRISNLETDSIQIYASGEINIDFCKANFIDPNSSRKITVSNSVVKAINIDLDIVNSWNIEPNCDVDTIFYTGSKRSNNMLLHSDSRGKIVWQPKNKEAELNIKIKGNTAQINFETQILYD